MSKDKREQNVKKGGLDKMKHDVKDLMNEEVDGVDVQIDDLYSEFVDDCLREFGYSLEDYLDEIDMDVLMAFVKCNKELKSFDALHGAVCGFTALPLLPDFDSNSDIFVENMMKDMVCSLEEKNRFEEALLTFYDCTEDFLFAENFVPYCGSWEFKDFETNNPKEWCSWFVSAFALIREMFEITDMDFARYFQMELSPMVILSFGDIHPEVEKIKRELAANGESWETFRQKMFESIPDATLNITERAVEYMEDHEEK